MRSYVQNENKLAGLASCFLFSAVFAIESTGGCLEMRGAVHSTVYAPNVNLLDGFQQCDHEHLVLGDGHRPRKRPVFFSFFFPFFFLFPGWEATKVRDIGFVDWAILHHFECCCL
jgi:hypothetical protein